jgi:hypothetical protein
MDTDRVGPLLFLPLVLANLPSVSTQVATGSRVIATRTFVLALASLTALASLVLPVRYSVRLVRLFSGQFRLFLLPDLPPSTQTPQASFLPQVGPRMGQVLAMPSSPVPQPGGEYKQVAHMPTITIAGVLNGLCLKPFLVPVPVRVLGHLGMLATVCPPLPPIRQSTTKFSSLLSIT